MAGAPPSIVGATTLTYARDAAPGLPRTLHNYIQTLIWTAIAIGFCAALYAIEKFVFIRQLGWLPDDTLYRMFKNPAEVPMRLFGMPHIMIGTLFLFSSRRMNNPNAFAWLFGLTAVGIGFCWLFYTFGTTDVQVNTRSFGTVVERHAHPLALLVFYFYFLIHGFRDEAFFYRAYGDMPRNAGPTHDRIMVVLQVLMLGLLISLALPAYTLYGQIRPEFRHPALDQMFPASWPYPFWFAMTFLPFAAVATWSLRRIASAFPDGLRGLCRMHWPILTVFAISTGIILIALGTGPWTFNFVVLMHFVGWYLFGRASLRQREPQTPPSNWWTWMRTTVRGFTFLHMGLAVVFVLLVAVGVYGFGKQGVLELLFGSKTFYYWTIMHVTLSFYPRP